MSLRRVKRSVKALSYIHYAKKQCLKNPILFLFDPITVDHPITVILFAYFLIKDKLQNDKKISQFLVFFYLFGGWVERKVKLSKS